GSKINTSILDMDATALAEKLRNGKLTSIEAVTTYIEHIQKTNPQINALVEDRFEEATAEALQFDENQRNGKKQNGKLAGVPISVKEAFNVANMKTAGGLEHRQDLIARDHAEVIQKLRDEG